jgi:tetratricopeptide (TPR) repeat protein
MAIQTNPEHYDAYIWYAKTLYQLARYEEAMTALNTALELDDNEEGSHFDEALPDDELQSLYDDLQQKLNK